MRKHNVLALLGVAMLGVACAQPPEAEMAALDQAVVAAQEAKAEVYATDAWTSAQDAVTAARTEMEAQKAKFALTRSYGKTKELITAASTAAGEAQAAAVAGKEQARNDAQAAFDGAKASLEQAGVLMTELGACKRKPKGFDVEMTALQAKLDGLNGQVAGIESAIAGEDFMGAKAQGETLKTEADTLVADLGAGKTKIGC